MSTKALYYLAVTLLVSTFGIYMPLFITGFELYALYLSITMYAIPMVLGSSAESIVFNDRTKRERIITFLTIILVGLICTIHVYFINDKNLILSTIFTIIIFVATLFLNWKQLDNKDFSDSTASLGGDINN